MINFKKQLLGSEVIVEISGNNRNEVVQNFWSFWNHGATNGEFCWTNDGGGDNYCGYFWTDIPRLEKACINREIFKSANGLEGEIPEETIKAGEILGRSFFHSIPIEVFYVPPKDAQIVIDEPEEN